MGGGELLVEVCVSGGQWPSAAVGRLRAPFSIKDLVLPPFRRDVKTDDKLPRFTIRPHPRPLQPQDGVTGVGQDERTAEEG